MPARRNGQGKYMTCLVMLNFFIIYSYFCLDKLFGSEFTYYVSIKRSIFKMVIYLLYDFFKDGMNRTVLCIRLYYHFDPILHSIIYS